jgi:competence ComEA-like helix-hairpin-helix protein
VEETEGITLPESEPTQIEEVIPGTDMERIPEGLADQDEKILEEKTTIGDQEGEVEVDTPDVPEWVELPVEDSRIGTFHSGVTGWLGDIDEKELAKRPIEYGTGELPSWLEGLNGVQKEEKTEPSVEKPEPDQPIITPYKAPEEEITPEFEDADDAMAWLESLAAKRGIPEEELITKPEDRSGEPPDWVQELTEEDSSDQQEEVSAEVDEGISQELVSDGKDTSAVIVEDPEALFGDHKDFDFDDELITQDPESALAWLENLANKEAGEKELTPDTLPTQDLSVNLEDQEPSRIFEAEVSLEEPAALDLERPPASEDSVSTDEIEPEVTPSDLDADLAWLESLAAKQGVPEEELLTSEADRTDEPPEWIQQEMDEIEPEKEPTVVADQEAETGEPAIPSPEDEGLVDSEVAVDLPDFLKERSWTEPREAITTVQEGDKIEAEVQDLIEPQIDRAEEEAISKDIPDWVQERLEGDLEETTQEIERATPTSLGTLEPDDVQQIPSDIEVDPEKRETLNLNTATMIQLERLPSLGFRSAQAIVTYRDEQGPFESLEELTKVPGLDAETIRALESEVKITAPVEVEEQEPETGSLLPLPETEPEDEDHAVLLSAQTDFAQGDASSAISKYGSLIKRGKRLEGVIEDLNQALLGDMPNEICVDILQVLGDAYMRSDKIQNALDAYTKAEELLR